MPMKWEFTNADVAQLLKIQDHLRERLQRYKGNTPAIVVAMACFRVGEALLKSYSDEERKEVIDLVIIPYLLGETKMREPSTKPSRLILPPFGMD